MHVMHGPFIFHQEEKMDKALISTKHMTLYASTYQIGLSITVVPSHKALYIMVGIFELEILLGNRW